MTQSDGESEAEESETEKFHDCDFPSSDDERNLDGNNDDEANGIENMAGVAKTEADDGIICPDANNLEIYGDSVIVSEEIVTANFVEAVQKCQSDLILFETIQTLQNTGSKLGVSLTMNRGMKALATIQKIGAESGNITWGKFKKIMREKLLKVFCAVVPATPDWLFLTTAILEPFIPKKVVVNVIPIRNMDVDMVPDILSNRVSDRVALLACALTDRAMFDYWVDVAKP